MHGREVYSTLLLTAATLGHGHHVGSTDFLHYESNETMQAVNCMQGSVGHIAPCLSMKILNGPTFEIRDLENVCVENTCTSDRYLKQNGRRVQESVATSSLSEIPEKFLTRK